MNRRMRGVTTLWRAVLILIALTTPAAAQVPGTIQTVAGTDDSYYNGDGIQATAATISTPFSVSIDRAGNIFIADYYHSRIRKVDAATGLISTIVGDACCTLGDGGPAALAWIKDPIAVLVDGAGNVYISDSYHYMIRKIDAATGIISAVIGDGTYGDNGDGGPATAARVGMPYGLAIDPSGNLFFSDMYYQRVRKIDAITGVVTAVAGTGVQGFSGDGGPATEARLNGPWGLATDAAGNLYIADTVNHRVRKVEAATGLITTVAGTGANGHTGDGGAATLAQVGSPAGVAVTHAGALLITEAGAEYVRKVENGMISTIAGNGIPGLSGDGGPATAASLNHPYAIAVDDAGNAYIADSYNHRIRKVSLAEPARMDFDADRRADILWRHSVRGEVWRWPMDGAVRVAEQYVQTVGDTGFDIRGIADSTADGKADLLWRHATTGALYLWHMSGGTLVSETYVGTVETEYDIAGTGDFNADGKADILWRNPANGEVWLWLMNGGTPESKAFVGVVDPAYVIRGVGDLNGDYKADIVWRHSAAGEVWVWLMNGAARQAETWVNTVPDLGYRIVGVADHTGDGKADLLWHHDTRGEVWLWPMDGTTVLSESYVATVPETEYRIVGNGDYDGDGQADILWHHATRGEVWVWRMDGPVKLAETHVATVPDGGYQIVNVK